MKAMIHSFVIALVSILALLAPAEARLMYGMLDSNGEVILPFEYAAIAPSSKGRLLVTPLSADQKSFLEPFYVNEEGKRLNEKADYPSMLTGGWSYDPRRILSAFDSPRKIEKNYRKKFPKSVNWIFAQGDNGWFPAAFGAEGKIEQVYRPGDGSKIGFVDQNGQIKLAPKFEAASAFRRGKAVVSLKSDECLDAANQKVSWGLIDENGKMLISGYSWLYGVGKSFIAAKRSGNSFDAAMWRNPGLKRIFGFDRGEEWRQFIDSYDLIGMSRDQVYELLGDPDEVPRRHHSPTAPENETLITLESLGKLPTINYHIWNSSCGSLGYSGVQIEFGADDTVTGWCNTNSDGEGKKLGEWVRKNVGSGGRSLKETEADKTGSGENLK